MKEVIIEFTVTVDETLTDEEIEREIAALTDLLQFETKNLKIISMAQHLLDQYRKFQEQIDEADRYKKNMPYQRSPLSPYSPSINEPSIAPNKPKWGDPPFNYPTYKCRQG